jgi:hypothetical protein
MKMRHDPDGVILPRLRKPLAAAVVVAAVATVAAPKAAQTDDAKCRHDAISSATK